MGESTKQFGRRSFFCGGWQESKANRNGTGAIANDHFRKSGNSRSAKRASQKRFTNFPGQQGEKSEARVGTKLFGVTKTQSVLLSCIGGAMGFGLGEAVSVGTAIIVKTGEFLGVVFILESIIDAGRMGGKVQGRRIKQLRQKPRKYAAKGHGKGQPRPNLPLETVQQPEDKSGSKGSEGRKGPKPAAPSEPVPAFETGRGIYAEAGARGFSGQRPPPHGPGADAHAISGLLAPASDAARREYGVLRCRQSDVRTDSHVTALAVRR